MIPITLLKPTWDKARTSKRFVLENKQAKLASAYDLGTKFQWSEVKVSCIAGYYKLLTRCADKPVFRIYGKPAPDLGKVVSRNKSTFLDAGTNLLVIDIDDWPVPDGFSMRTPARIYETIKEIVSSRMGIKPLCNVACCVFLSSSFWNWNRIRAHVYYEISDTISLDLLHTWAKAYNSTSPDYKLDPAMFLQVQPDFISKRCCDGFVDPLPDNLRLTLHCDNLAPTVDKVALEEYLHKVVNDSELYSPVSTTSVVKSGAASTWEQTLQLCGSAQHGINEPAYRGCAQLVKEVGNLIVKDNMVYYVEKVFNLVWQSIAQHGVRGDKKDRKYYDKARFRNYLATALQKSFGEGADTRVAAVTAALKKVLEGANVAILFDRDMLDNYREIRSKDPGKWALIQNVIKIKLKGKVTIADITKAMQSSSKVDIQSMIDQVIKSFQWIEGSIDQGLYCKTKNNSGYQLIGIDSGVESDIYSKAIELFSDAVPSQFEKSVMKILVARSRDPQTSVFHSAVVENRCYANMEDNKNILYINLGTSAKGDMTTCRVTEDGIEVMPSAKSPVIWSTDRQIMECEILEDEDIANMQDHIKYYFSNISKFVTAEDTEALIDIMAWQVAALVNTGTAPILEITGGSNDGKSTAALFTKELIDPTSSNIRDGQDLHNGLYKKEDLCKILRSRHVTIIDNLSNLTPAQQDLLCSIATGWKYDLRLMYTQQFLRLVIKKPLILTSLAPVITNQDLRSRSISVVVTKKKKQDTGDIYALWEKNKKRMRTGLLYLTTKVIKYVNTLRSTNGNLNDRDLWATAARIVILKELNYKGGDSAAISRLINKRKMSRDIYEALISGPASQVIAWVMNDVDVFVGDKVIESPTALFIAFKKYMNEHAGDVVKAHGTDIEITTKYMPNSARGFGITLSKIRNDLHSVTGWTLDSVRPGGNRMWRFTKDKLHSTIETV